MSYARKVLADGERVVHASRQHALAVVSRSGLWLLLALAGAAIAIWSRSALEGGGETAASIAGGIAFLVGAAVSGKELLLWHSEEYLVTTLRVIKSEGIFHKRLAETNLEKINDARIEQSWMGRLLGYGDLDLLTAADESPLDDFPMLADPIGFQLAISNQQNELLKAAGLHPATD
jgi:uncharacterized membrane protein YdbT with pleckstrin-like domain